MKLRGRGAERTVWVREHRRARLNSRFDAESAPLIYLVVKSGFLNFLISVKIQKSGFQYREGWMKLRGRGAERTVWVREHRRAWLNSRFDAESAPLIYLVVKSGFLNFLTDCK